MEGKPGDCDQDHFDMSVEGDQVIPAGRSWHWRSWGFLGFSKGMLGLGQLLLKPQDRSLLGAIMRLHGHLQFLDLVFHVGAEEACRSFALAHAVD